MDYVIAFFMGVAVAGFVAYITTYVAIEGGWKEDCAKLGLHVAASNGAVYRCEPRK